MVLAMLQPQDDLLLLLTAAWSAANERVLARTAAAGFGDLRPSHGYLFQHLIPGPLPVGEVARRLGVTPQGASKAIGELEAMGYLGRRADEADQRARIVALTERGWAAVEAGRVARAEVTAELRAMVGEAEAERLIASLRRLAVASGGLAALTGRRLRLPR
jgi:DNA-binding MarR family transcriptional regulator